MPLTRICLIKGKTSTYIRAIADGVQQALVETYGVPAADRFQLVHQYEREEMIFDTDYLGIHRTDNVVIINITASNWRDTGQKKQLYRSIADNLARNPGLRTEDVIIVLSPNERDDWSFGNGLASYANDDAA